eukprot:CAMPEP_0194203670 /NCGR_PEP_ID=MMETSP0156-20130528/3383_1 /TAXON_ID=33649 /ORGANISM="Thalassionema nitzschioides, Strain L26-B" /LENGTH=419 /DNA_ID=CAMNT_0038929461 /DNA_START=185 /DNA_END=1444 /DNA_ORIENTATION=-
MNDVTVLRKALTDGICLGLPGVAMAISTKAGLWSGADGFASLQEDIPLSTKKHAFCVGSITQTFVSVVILQLAEEGYLDLDQTALEYLKENNSNCDVSEIPNIDQASLRQLLSHKSGIPNYREVPKWIRKGRGADMERGSLRPKTEPLSFIKDKKATFAPGQEFQESATNYTLLGLVIQSVTGNTAEDEIRNRILIPLGLNHTHLDSFEDSNILNPAAAQSSPSSKLSRPVLANHYHYATPSFLETAGYSDACFEKVPGRWPYMIETTKANFSAEWTAGGMVMTVKDMVMLGQALRDAQQEQYNGGEEKQALHEMFIHQEPENPHNPGTDSSQTTQFCMGIGKSAIPKLPCESIWTQDGKTLGFQTKLFWMEHSDCVVAVATNIGSVHSDLGQAEAWNIWLEKSLFPAVQQYLIQNALL